jgi:hypothetical protein
MAGMKLFEPRLVEFCYRQSTPLEPVAEIHYQCIFGCYGTRSVTLAGEELRKFIYVRGE